MQVQRQDDGTYSLTGMTADEAEGLAALAAFPVWGSQPARMGTLCAGLHDAVMSADVGSDPYITADTVGMVPHVTVN